MPGPQTPRILAFWSVSPTIVWSLSDGFDLGIPSPSPVPSPNHRSLTLLHNRFDPTRAALARVAARVPAPAQNPFSTPFDDEAGVEAFLAHATEQCQGARSQTLHDLINVGSGQPSKGCCHSPAHARTGPRANAIER
ncbi:hypothetical protein EDB84DRAFT_1564700 [Lactarius hengduanensis]|nr:hypothetical protein EDB84DRAFT_1570464 [Lactarius hengduanensis]KAH9023460.1 hypothetical protein EDB84DRAFT_1564700 [Lactarius hengduanensis]